MSCLRTPLASRATLNCRPIPMDLSKQKRLTLAGLALAATIGMLPLGALCQTTAGSITGTVVDQQQAFVPNATVTATNLAQNANTQVSTDSKGHFVFPVLLPGLYNVTAVAPGFAPETRTGINLNSNSLLTLDTFQLKVGAAAQTVQVRSNGQELDVDTAQRGESIIGEQIQNIQVNGQSPLFFLTLVPGIYTPPNQYVQSTQQFGSSYVNGSSSNQLHVTVNGGTNEDTGGNSGWMAPLSLDAVQEVKVLTNSYEAE
ncbi:MAG: carboxypeptidase-like regulatory domain-containing protein, partial [Acidobacteriaceae bacterium]